MWYVSNHIQVYHCCYIRKAASDHDWINSFRVVNTDDSDATVQLSDDKLVQQSDSNFDKDFTHVIAFE